MSFGEDIAALVAKNGYGALAAGPGWTRVPLGEVAKVVNGFAFESKFFSGNSGLPLVRIRDVVSGGSGTFYSGPIPVGYDVEDGDLLVGMDGDFNSAFWLGGHALLNQRVCKIVPDEKRLRLRYLAYALPAYLKLINEHTSSVTVKHLSSRTLQAIPLPLPEPGVQDRLIARIDALFAEIDVGERALAAAREGVETYSKSLLKAAVTGELTTDFRLANPSAETGEDLLHGILADRRSRWEANSRNLGKMYADPARPSAEELPGLPAGWSWAFSETLTTGDRGEIVIGPFGSDLKVSDYRDEGVPLVFVRHIRSGDFRGLRPQFVSSTKAQQLRMHRAIAGDLLVTKMGDPPGDAAIYPDAPPAIVTADCIRWRPHSLLNVRFLEAWINSYWGRRWITKQTKGVAQQKISLELFKMLPVPVPPKVEQDEIVKLLIRSSLAAEKTGLDLLAAGPADLRQSILAGAFCGDLAE